MIGVPIGAGDAAMPAVAAVQSALAPITGALRWRLVVASARTGEADEPLIATAAEVVHRHYAQQPSDALQVPYHGLAGRGRALQAILEEAHAAQARACVILDPRHAGTTRVDELIRPLLEDTADVVTPIYTRHPYSGAVVHGLVYPLFRSVYGARLRYPIGSDVGLSRAFIDAVVTDPIWQTDAAQIGIDLWLAATAVSAGFRLGQGYVGERVEERPDLDLGTILAQVVGFCFQDMERRAASWQRVRTSKPVPVVGQRPATPDPIDIDVATLADTFRLASRELQDVWAEVLPPLAVLQWRRLATTPLDAFRVDDALWARTIYDFAMGHRLRVMARDHLLGSLAPLYLAWLASFVRETRHLPPDEAEAGIERLCLAFEAEKPYLVSQWRWPERFKPVKRRGPAGA